RAPEEAPRWRGGWSLRLGRSASRARKNPRPLAGPGISWNLTKKLLHLLEELLGFLRIDGVLALRPVGGADFAGLRRLLGRVERPQDLVHVAADVEEVHRLALDDAVRVDQEHAAEGDALRLVEHAVVARDALGDVGEDGIVGAGDAALIARGVVPRQVRVLA